jgi:peptidase E
MQIAVVATEGAVKDFAAYIGATQGAFLKFETIAWTINYGAKLTKKEALVFLPGLAYLEGYHYRR